MNELIKWAVQSEGFANAIQKGYVVRAWVAEKDGYDDVLVIRMAGEWFSIENFFTDKADRKYVEDRIMRMFRTIARYYDERFIDS